MLAPRQLSLPREPEDDFVLLELVRGDRPLEARDFEEPLPDWLDLLFCVVLPTLVALVVIALFQLSHLAGVLT